MRLRVIVPVLLAVAAVVGLIFGAVLPSGQSSATGSAAADDGAAAVGPTDGGSPTTNAAQPEFQVTKLKPGEKPPQFVVVSFDGACKDQLFDHYMQIADKIGARYTWFLSGLCLLPEQEKFLYKPPLKPAGSSAIGFADAKLIPDRIRNYADAYAKGHEIGTHALGHFCGPGGVGAWSSADWRKEFAQVKSFLDNWRANLAKVDPALAQNVPDLPFNSSELKGIRTPCLEGNRSAMWPVWKQMGFTYDASGTGELQWPTKVKGTTMWEFPLQAIKLIGYGNKPVLSMDYNFLCNQNNCNQKATPAASARMAESAYQSYLAALKAVCTGNRAPLSIGNHLNTWAGGAYYKALSRFLVDATSVCPDVRFITFGDLVKWLDAQDPAVLKALRAKGVQGY